MWLLRSGLEFTAKAVWATAWFAWRRIIVPTAQWTKYVLRDVIAKKVIRAPIKWSGEKIGSAISYLGRKWRSVVTKSAGAVKNVLTTGTAKTSSLATKVWDKIADTLKATARIPGKMRNSAVESSKEAIDLVFNLPSHLDKTGPVKDAKEWWDVFFNLPAHLRKEGKPTPT
jgi:hypothetical protein